MSIIKKIFRKLLYNWSDRTRFTLVLRNWGGVSDINILSKALQTETFRSYVKHLPYSPKKNTTYLVLAPHQDDELIGTGGLLLKNRDIGAKTAICFVTNGAQNNLLLSGKRLSQEEVIDLRRKEAISVCKELSAKFYELNIDNVSMNITQDHINKLTQIIKTIQPDIILCPWIFDGSAKHRAVNHVLYHAIEKITEPKTMEIWGYQVNNPIFSNIVVDTTDQIEEKNKLLNLYRSQNIGIKNYTHLAEGLAAWNSRYLPSKTAKGKKQYAELFMTLHISQFKLLIKKFYLPNIESTFFNEKRIIKSAKNIENNTMS